MIPSKRKNEGPEKFLLNNKSPIFFWVWLVSVEDLLWVKEL
tara:strand:- start:90 stop:212 length:123 start_codon:yes stop_codon:yes gene_type:complete